MFRREDVRRNLVSAQPKKHNIPDTETSITQDFHSPEAVPDMPRTDMMDRDAETPADFGDKSEL